ncbi:MAG: hypothetical protein RMJ17_00025 [Candidatus Aenigmarchaeota archaeon]|nr:hypothetical protein [Candidatus Aenigmarchaeota archaeon]MDW8148978.1 hypothetical protein [Candidatus Aenigmarchaeota archaeon]
MGDVFANAMNFLLEKGFFNFLLWTFFSAVTYSLLKRTKILGESVFINGIVALTVSFFIFLFPYLAGINYVFNFSLYFAQLSLFLVVLIFSLLLASFFYPNLWETIEKLFTRRTQIWVMLALAFVLLLTSNLINIFTLPLINGGVVGGVRGPQLPQQISIFLAALFIFLVFILLGTAVVRGE